MKQILFFLLCVITMASCSEDKTERDALIQKAYKAGQESVFEVMDSVHNNHKNMIQDFHLSVTNQFQGLLHDTSNNELLLQKLKKIETLSQSVVVIKQNIQWEEEVNSIIKWLVDKNKPYIFIAKMGWMV